jgi:alpha-L-fucosidase
MKRIILSVLITGSACGAVQAADYEPTWESLATAPVPKWWSEGRLGIFIHWGPYSVAGYKDRHKGYAEAITADMYKKPERYTGFMTDKFGATMPDFGYKDMVPLFRAEKWDPAAWAKLFREAGATYVIPTGEHHDGFVLWDSGLTPWTATKKGPKRDLIGELGNAVRAEGLKYGISYHRERHPDRFTRETGLIEEEIRRMPEAASLYGPFEYDDAFIADYVARWKEAERKYRPDFMWIDDVPFLREDDPQVARFEAAFREMMADYLNAADEWGVQVWFNNKGKTANWPDGVGCREADNLQMDTIGPPWQNPATLGTSYAYMANEEINDLYKTPAELVRLLCDVVSKNGNLLLNIGPRADGTIPEGMQSRLRAMGQWLRVNGEAIYGSTPWITYGEHSGELIRDEEGVHYTSHSMCIHEKEFRFTAKPGVIYITAFQPLEQPVTLESFRGYDRKIKSASILGSDAEVEWEQVPGGLKLSAPGVPFSQAMVFKLEV